MEFNRAPSNIHEVGFHTMYGDDEKAARFLNAITAAALYVPPDENSVFCSLLAPASM